MPTLETVQIISLVASVLLFVAGIFKPVFMPLSYMVCSYGNLPLHFNFLHEIRYEPIIAVTGFIRVLFVKNAFKKISLRYDKVNLYLLFFLVTIAISFIFAFNLKHSWDGTLYGFVGVLLVYMMILISVNDERSIKFFIWGYVIVFALITYEPIYYYLTNANYFDEIQGYGVLYIARKGILSGHVSLANNMNQMIPIAFFLMISVRSKFLKIFAAIPLIMFVTALVISKSRGGVLGFMCIIFLVTFYSKNRLRNGLLGGLLVLLLLIASGSFTSTLQRVDSGAVEGRLMGLIHGIEMVRKGNILGVGPGCFPLARGYYFGYTMDAHNIYGEIIGDLGIPGAIAGFFLLWGVIKNNREILSKLKMANDENRYLYFTMMGIHISLLVRLFVSLGSHGLYILHWYFVAAMSIIISKLAINPNERDTMNKNMTESFQKIK
jgi:O-antigen ligase